MAATRDKRANAGSRMARLLDEEEEDDFYKTTYGGFDDVEDDKEYESENQVDSDSSDSDISRSEDDEVISDDEEQRQKRKRGVFTKAYTERVKKAKPDAQEKVKPKTVPKPRQKKTRSTQHHIDISAILHTGKCHSEFCCSVVFVL